MKHVLFGCACPYYSLSGHPGIYPKIHIHFTITADIFYCDINHCAQLLILGLSTLCFMATSARNVCNMLYSTNLIIVPGFIHLIVCH